MLTRSTKVKLAAFGLVAVLILVFTATRYANLGRFLGLRGYYVVHLELANYGRIYQSGDVTYRGVDVGRGGALRLTDEGISVDLAISNSAPRIPDRLHAAVADLSAVGEQYVDLRPTATRGPFLTGGSVLAQRGARPP